MAFSYNIDGGTIGDDPDEGISLSIFSPSTNYLMGSAFAFIFANEVSEPIGTCGVDPVCATVAALCRVAIVVAKRAAPFTAVCFAQEVQMFLVC